MLKPPNKIEAIQPDATDFVAAARTVAPPIARLATRIEREQELPKELLTALYDMRLFRMLLPRSVGGGEIDPARFFEAVEALAQADASTAWCVAQACGGSMVAAYLAPEIARTIFGSADAVVANGPATSGVKAIVVDGGYRVSGAWSFASGSRHATWFAGHCYVYEKDGSPRLAGGKPIDRTLLFPRESVRIAEAWDVIGLKGTRSDRYSVHELFVPEAFSCRRHSAAERREKGPLYRFTAMNLFPTGFSAVALGIARATLEAFIALAGHKVPTTGTRLLRDSGVVQSQVSLAEAKLQSSRAFVLQTLHELWAMASQGKDLAVDAQARLRLSAAYAIQQAKDVVDVCYHAAGASAIFAENPFERRFRDIHTVTQQVQAHPIVFEQVGQMLLGVESDSK
jgi:indole-3-acetate monooxygenase